MLKWSKNTINKILSFLNISGIQWIYYYKSSGFSFKMNLQLKLLNVKRPKITSWPIIYLLITCL